VSAFGTLFSTRYFGNDANGIPGVYFDIYTGLLVLAFLVALYAYIRRRPLSKGVTPRRHLLRNTAQTVMWICGVGLFFCVLRYTSVEYLDKRFYSYLVVVGAIAYAGYLTYYLSERHPLRVFHHHQLEAGKRYRATVKRKPVPATAVPGRAGMQRGKRRR